MSSNKRKYYINKKHYNRDVNNSSNNNISNSEKELLKEDDIYIKQIDESLNLLIDDSMLNENNDVYLNNESYLDMLQKDDGSTIIDDIITSYDGFFNDTQVNSLNNDNSLNMEVTNVVSDNEEKTDKKVNNYLHNINIYFGYSGRLIVSSVCLLLLFVVSILSVLNMYVVSEESYFNYSEQSNVDYKVYLKDNNFYEEDYLEKDMLYVASLIDYINVDFLYNFSSEKNVDVNFKYNVYAKLVITDFNNQNIFYEKKFPLIDNKNITLNEGSYQKIVESLKINYDYYNKIANNFKNSYGLSTKSNLIIYFNIDKNLDKDTKALMENPNNYVYLEIPLSEKAVDISLKYKDINDTSKIILTKDNGVKINAWYVLLALVSILALLIIFVKIVKYISYLFVRKSAYDTYLNKILDEYDRLIVKTVTSPLKILKDESSLIKVDSFEELLDVRDNLKKPIMYYVITNHIKCQFYINDGDKVYITTVKAVDLEVKNEK